MANLGEVLASARRASRPSLLVYMMAGSVPDDRLLEVVDALVGADVTGLELGFPFSDPMAEGPVIQRAASDALGRGFRWKDLLGVLRTASARLPCAVMTYLNPILQRGEEAALGELREAGASALILPDLPVEAAGPLRRARTRTRVDTVLLATPATGPERLGRIIRGTQGFLYLVSRFGTTGVRTGPADLPSQAGAEGELAPLVQEAHRVRPRLPVLVGFGISAPEDVRRHLDSGADGVIVGSSVQARLTEGRSAQEIAGNVASLRPKA